MNYDIVLHPKAHDQLKKLEKEIKERIKKKIKELQTSPQKRGKRLKGSNFWRQRIGDYRAIYEIKEKQEKIRILFIGHRKNVYDNFKRLF